MSKALALLFLAIMAIQVIRPLGWPGLARRRDAWKLAAAALVLMAIAASVSHLR